MYEYNVNLINKLIEKRQFKKKVYPLTEFEISSEKFERSLFFIAKGSIAIRKIHKNGEYYFVKLLRKNQTYGGVLNPLNDTSSSNVKILLADTIIFEFLFKVNTRN